ncbi:hypothetical protein [Moorena sp. SIO3I6]|uniref:hypothetical protein n=1 Tax=Moorena sp. SIO3I6 TaxID=2607831 RepID=UPI0013FB5DAB|nr:hypothetical protein [Moorena sp. SIO3I6]NEP29720.1 hypothetical protein [Moorena sp. SIO3I6]
MGILRGSDAARSWGGSAVLGVPPMSDCIKTLASCQFQYISERAGCPLYSYSFKA